MRKCARFGDEDIICHQCACRMECHLFMLFQYLVDLFQNLSFPSALYKLLLTLYYIALQNLLFTHDSHKYCNDPFRGSKPCFLRRWTCNLERHLLVTIALAATIYSITPKLNDCCYDGDDDVGDDECMMMTMMSVTMGVG